ncbi:MAG TPA: hypothetical protein VHT73_09310, partial [Thermodesulfobacteriota bacterium]|nr:hypothetical protein [Thermodesulfobacteriota bacterium]
MNCGVNLDGTRYECKKHITVREQCYFSSGYGKSSKGQWICGYKVEFAFDKAGGLEKIKKKEYDLIIICTQFKGNGEKFYTELLSFNENLAKKVMFISGNITEFIRLTGNPFLEKPFT